MNKIFTCLSSGLMLLLFISTANTASLFSHSSFSHTNDKSEAPTAVMDLGLFLEDITVDPDDQFCLGVSVDNFTDINGMQFSIRFDEDQLQFDQVANFGLPGITAASFGTNNASNGVITFTWTDPELDGHTVSDGTVIFEVCFTAIGSSNSDVMFSSNPTAIEVINANDEEVNTQTNNGTVTNTADDGSGSGGGGGDINLTLEDATVASGSNVCLDITVDNFANINGLQFSLAFDEGQLDFTQVTSFGLPGMTAASFGTNNADNGVVTFTWTDPELDGHTVNDGTVIFEICFTATGSGTTVVDFSNTPTSIEIINADDEEVMAVTEEGTVNITGGGTGGGGDDFMLTLEDATVASGSTVCLDVTVDNFTNINGLQFSLAFDEGQLDFTQVTSFGLPGMTAASFGTNNADNGVVTFTWTDPELDGHTVNDGTVIFEICFTATGSGTTVVDFSNTPTSIEVINASDQEVTAVTEEGTVNITGGGTGGDDFMLTLEDATVASGSDVCLDITVDNFTNINGLQFSLAFDEGQLDFTQVTSFGLPGMTAASFGTNNADNGVVTFTWTDQELDGHTVNDGTVIFQICFTATGSGTTVVDFSNTPTSIEVINASDEEVTAVTEEGTVTITGSGGGGGDDFTLTLEDVTVESGNDGCLDVTVDNFTNINGLQFSLAFDEGQLDFTQVTNFGLPGMTAASFGTNNADNGVVTFTWTDPELDGHTVSDGTVIFQICFTAIGGAGTTVVDFSNTPTSIEVINADDEEITAVTEEGTVTITGDSGVDGFLLTLEDKTVDPGSDFCLDVTVNDFNNINGLQFSIAFDESQLDFTQVTSFGLPGMTAASFGTNNADNGVVTFTWTDPELDGHTVSDGTVIFQICFTAIGSGITVVDFSNTPTSIEVIDANDEEVMASTEEGTVNIMAGGGGPDEVTFTIADASAEQGDNVCLDVTVEDFTDINDAQFTITFDESQLDFTQVTGFGLPGLDAANFDDSSADNGTLLFGWSDPDADGTTLADGTVIFQLCFDANGAGSTTVDIGNTPIAIEVTDVNGADVPVQTESGTITISNLPDGFAIIAGSISDACTAGQAFCLPVSVNEFVDINGIQFTMSFDPDFVSFVSIGAFGLPGLTNANFGTNNASNGVVTFNWLDPELDGHTLTNGPNVIFEVCFTLDAVPPGLTTFSITGTPTAIEVINNMDEEVIASIVNGTISCGDVASPPVVTDVDIVNLQCANESTGSITINEVSGVGPYTYMWSPGGATTNSITNLSQGTYVVTVTDQGTGLTASFSYNVASPNPLVVTTSQILNVACAGENTGAISLNIGGGTPFYSIDWCCNLPDGSSTVTNLAPGTYGVTVTDNNGCVTSLNNITINGPSNPLDATFVVTSISNGNNGAIDLTPVGGTAPYSYNWELPDGSNRPTQDLMNLNTTGEYCVTITDAASCTYAECLTLGQILQIESFVPSRPCFGESDGGIDISVSGGTGAGTYSYQWENTETGATYDTEDLSGVPAGSYSVTVTDANNETRTGTTDLPSFPEIVITPTITEAGLNNNQGSISLNVSGGTPGFTYQWDSGQTSASISGLAAGNYCVTVTDDAGCTETGCYDVFSAPLSFTLSPENVSCNGANDGSVTVMPTGGTQPYTIEVMGQTPVTQAGPSITVDGLGAGTFSIIIRDANGTALNDQFTITMPEALTYTESFNCDTEDNGCSGSISLNIAGGTAPYTVTWTNTTQTGPQIFQLCAGTYIPTIVDARGCTLATTAVVISAMNISPTFNNASCTDAADGSISVNVEGCSGGYSYSWVNADGDEVDTDATLNDVAAGVYTLTVLDDSGTQLVREYTLEANASFTAGFAISSDYNGFGVSCADSADGIVMATPDDADNYSYEWELDGNMVAMGQTVNNLTAGSYTLIVIDNDTGCESTTTFSLQAPTEIRTVADVDAVSCIGDIDGEIFAVASGGITDAPYTYAWSDGQMGARAENLVPGEYTLTVTDDNGCTFVESYTVTEPERLTVVVETEATTEDCNGTARVVVSGGTAPYRYNWQNVPNNPTTGVVTDLCAGTYEVIVTDANDCSSVEAEGTVLNREFPCLDKRIVITPDGDGLNDTFIIACIDELTDNHLEIYNRWGQLVFQVDNYDNFWMGTTIDGSDLPAGPYYWVLEYTDITGEMIQQKGSLTLVRE